jgi:hypothetical protein
MRAHTITTKSRVGGRGRMKRTIVPRGILALSLAVVLVAATASAASAERGPTAALTGTAVTTPTPPLPPLTLEVYLEVHYLPPAAASKKLQLAATTSNDSTLVATGSKIKKATKQLAAGKQTLIKAKLKHRKRLNRKPTPKVVVKVAVTDEFGQTATSELRCRIRTTDDCYGVTSYPEEG